MPVSKLPDLAVQEYARHKYEDIGEVKPYYTYIFHKLAHKVTNKTHNNNVRKMLAKETHNYIRQLKGTPMPVVVTYTPLPTLTHTPTAAPNKNRMTRKNKNKKQQSQQQTHVYIEQGNNVFNDPYYKANETGYIRALNYTTNNNMQRIL